MVVLNFAVLSIFRSSSCSSVLDFLLQSSKYLLSNTCSVYYWMPAYCLSNLHNISEACKLNVMMPCANFMWCCADLTLGSPDDSINCIDNVSFHLTLLLLRHAFYVSLFKRLMCSFLSMLAWLCQPSACQCPAARSAISVLLLLQASVLCTVLWHMTSVYAWML